MEDGRMTDPKPPPKDMDPVAIEAELRDLDTELTRIEAEKAPPAQTLSELASCGSSSLGAKAVLPERGTALNFYCDWV